jgi:hypothetical protein
MSQINKGTEVFKQRKIVTEMALPNRMSFRPDLLWLTLNLALIIRCLQTIGSQAVKLSAMGAGRALTPGRFLVLISV